MKISKEWLDKNLMFSGYWFTKDIGSKYRPLKIIVHTSDEIKDGWYIALWDESEEVVIYEGENYTIKRFKRLYFALRGKKLIEK